MYADSDKSFRAFTQACADVGKDCALARDGSTAEEIERKVFDLMFKLKYEPLSYAGTLIDWSYIRGSTIASLYSTSWFEVYAEIIDGLSKGNASAISLLNLPNADIGDTGERRAGIICGDKTTRGREDARSAIEAVSSLSKVGGDTAAQIMSLCGQWKMEAKERYSGSLEGIRTANPIFILQNRYDPVTPVVSARNMSAVFEGSVVLEQNGHGVSNHSLELIQKRSRILTNFPARFTCSTVSLHP